MKDDMSRTDKRVFFAYLTFLIVICFGYGLAAILEHLEVI